MKKRILAVLLVLLTVAVMFPMRSFAEETLVIPACSGSPACWGEVNGDAINNHTDGCARKDFLKTYVTTHTASEVAAIWVNLTEEEQADMMLMVESYTDYADTLKEMVNWQGSEDPTDPEGPYPDVPSLTDPDSSLTVYAEEFPEGVSLHVETADITSQLSQFGIPAAKKVFGLDISLLNGDNTQYQPETGAVVKVPVSADEGTLIGILHTHNGVTTLMGLSEVLSDGTIEFYTDEFSEFAGFTVDFHYNGVSFSIDGETSILLSELFSAMGINEDASLATSVVFSDTSLVKVEKEGNDWRLISEEAFLTQETLVITFSDGHIIVIDVTDEMQAKLPFTSGRATGHISYGVTGGQRFHVYLYEGNNTTAFDSAYTSQTNITGAAWLNITSGQYWFEVREVTGSSVLANNPYDPAVSNILDNLNEHTIAYRMRLFQGDNTYTHLKCWPIAVTTSSTSNYCYINLVSKLIAEESHKETRNVHIYVGRNGSDVLVQQVNGIVFPDRNGDKNGHDQIDAGRDLQKPTCAPGYSHRSTTDDNNRTYQVYLDLIPYTISYNLGNGSLAAGESNPTSYNVESNTITLKNPTKVGYIFKGWTGSNGSTPSKNVTIPKGSTGNKSYTAVWEAIPYTVTYDVNGATSGAIADQTHKFDEEFTLPTPRKEYTVSFDNDGNGTVDSTATVAYTFNGWEDRGTIVYNGVSYDAAAFDGPYYANTYGDLYNAFKYNKYDLIGHYVNNGKSEGRSPVGSTRGYYLTGKLTVKNLASTNITVPLKANWSSNSIALPSLSGTGKRFLGWSYNSTTYAAGDSFTPTENVTLTALWEDDTYTVTWKNWNGDILDTDTVIHGGSATYSGAQPSCQDADGYSYSFTGWDTGSNGTVSNVTANTTVTAQYSPNPINYTATFNYNGGDAGEASKTFNVTTALSLPKLTRTGYTGVWKVTSAAGNWVDGAEYASEGSVTAGKYGNVTFTAQWTALYRYVLKFDANTTNQVSNLPTAQDTGWIDAATKNFTWSMTPTREGYSFLGWAEAPTSQTNVAGSGYNSYQVTGKKAEAVEKTLYAIWKRDTGNLKLTFNGGDTTPAIVNVKGQGLDITVVLTKAETIIKDLPTGTYNITAVSGNASYTASVDLDSDSTPTIEKNKTAEVEITIQSKGLNWFTAFFRKKNVCS